MNGEYEFILNGKMILGMGKLCSKTWRIYTKENATCKSLAVFKDEESAKEFLEAIRILLKKD